MPLEKILNMILCFLLTLFQAVVQQSGWHWKPYIKRKSCMAKLSLFIQSVIFYCNK